MAAPILLSDLDGTLIDYNDHHVKTFLKALRAVGVDLPEAEYRNRILRDYYGILDELGVGSTSEVFWTLYTQFNQRAKAVEEGLVRLFDDSLYFLEKMQGQNWAVVSDTPVDIALEEINALCIKDLIPLMFNCSSTQDQKPNIQLGMQALEKLCYDGEPVCVVGDAHSDVAFARNLEAHLKSDCSNARVYSVLVHSASGEADYVAQNLKQAYEFFESLRKR